MKMFCCQGTSREADCERTTPVGSTHHIHCSVVRVLLERLIVNRPHPWGLLITFIELIKNPQFKFWNHEFVHCAPEIEK